MKNVLPITFNTHNRTKCACYCLDKLIKNLIYDGDIFIYICDDRSENGHIDKLKEVFQNNNFTNYKIIESNEEHFGYGYVLNTALDDAYTYNDVVLTVEDDRLLEQQTDITPLIKILKENSDKYIGIRVAGVDDCLESNKEIEGFPKNLKRVCVPVPNWIYTYNLQCMIRHKKIFDKIRFKENCDPPLVEWVMCVEYNQMTDYGKNDEYVVLQYLRDNNDEFFIHLGGSTLDHNCWTPDKYKFLFE